MEGVSRPCAFLLETLSAAMASNQAPPQYSRSPPLQIRLLNLRRAHSSLCSQTLTSLLAFALSTCLRQAFKSAHVPVVVQASKLEKNFQTRGRMKGETSLLEQGREGQCRTLGWLPDSQEN